VQDLRINILTRPNKLARLAKSQPHSKIEEQTFRRDFLQPIQLPYVKVSLLSLAEIIAILVCAYSAFRKTFISGAQFLDEIDSRRHGANLQI
jgi:hypothetical protein